LKPGRLGVIGLSVGFNLNAHGASVRHGALKRLCQLSPAAAGLNQFCQLKEIIDFKD
jgi:hypothetical protein